MPVPTRNPVLASGASAAPAVTTWNPSAIGANITLSSGNRTATGVTSASFSNVQSSTQKNSGNLYFEITNLVTQSQAGGAPGVAFVIPSFNLNTYMENGGGSTFLTYGELRSDTNTVTSSAYPVWQTAGDVLQVCVALGATRRAWVRKVGTANWNAGGGADPTTAVGGFVLGTAPGAAGVDVVFAAMLYAPGIAFSVNCGQSGFAGTIPSGFSQWG